ncbi:glycosyltransferase family 2 protein [Candidatus Woesearchaeota archaeon]|nr:glycosyltransferase family 2 protein [Candidatus Woesearchaeota archaeon]
MKILVIVPCYNAGKFIADTIADIKRYQGNILVIDDGSTDNSYGVIKKIKGIKILRHKHNKGKGAALKTGFKHAVKNNFDAVITIDADGQHKASDIPKFVDKISRFDIIVGSRMHNVRNMPLRRILANSLSSFIVSRKCRQKVPDSQSGYRLIKKDVIKDVKPEQDGYQFETEMLLKAAKLGYRIGWVPIKTIYGEEVSHINPFKITWRFIRVIFAGK